MSDFIIFGAGDTGKNVLYFLGWSRVRCFVANIEAETEIEGKRVIPYKYIEREELENNIIVVASLNYSEEISKQLVSDNLNNYFVFSNAHYLDTQEDLPEYFVQRRHQRIQYSDILSKACISKYRKIAIYGVFRSIEYLISEIAIQGARTNIYGIVDETGEIKEGYLGVPIVTWEDAIREADCIVLSIPRYRVKHMREIEESFIKVIDLFDCCDVINSLHYPEVEKYHNIHKGRRIFLIGNGPSLRVDDLDTLKRNGEICIAFNMINKIFQETEWRPTYLGISDPILSKTRLSEMTLYDIPIFACDRWHKLEYDYNNKNIIRLHMIEQEYSPNMPKFSDDLSRGIYLGYTVMYDVGMQLAMYMGASEIVLVGVDHSFDPSKPAKENSHFTKEYFNDNEAHLIDKGSYDKSWIELAYMRAEDVSYKYGCRVLNATRGGCLDIFERVDFDSLF